MRDAIPLIRLDPNGYGPSRFFHYAGDLAAIVPVDRQRRIHGWLIESWTSLRRKSRFVVYGEAGLLWLHAPDGLVCCSDGSATITYRKFLFWLSVTIRRPGSPEMRYRIVIPPLRYLFNDGMFPDDVEPLYDVLRQIDDSEKHARLRRSLSDGINLADIPDTVDGIPRRS